MKTVQLSAPKNYGEITEKQLRYIAALMISGQSEDQIRTKCFIRFTGIKPVACIDEVYFFVKPKLKGFFSLTTEQVASFSSTFAWITKDYKGFTPPVSVGKYKAVDRLLRETPFSAYLDAENYYQAYIHTKRNEYVAKLMAVLFPGKNNNKDKAVKFFSKSSEVDRLIAVMWFMSIKADFAKRFKFLYGEAETEGTDTAPPPDMYKIITNQVRMLTDGDVTKNNLVMAANTWDALTELNEKYREAAKLKDK